MSGNQQQQPSAARQTAREIAKLLRSVVSLDDAAAMIERHPMTARSLPPADEPRHTEMTLERVDFVADAIVAATAPLFDDFGVARSAARAAIAADAEFRNDYHGRWNAELTGPT